MLRPGRLAGQVVFPDRMEYIHRNRVLEELGLEKKYARSGLAVVMRKNEKLLVLIGTLGQIRDCSSSDIRFWNI